MPEDPRRTRGLLGEDLAEQHLLGAGYLVLERNFRTRHGELDLIARRPEALVFCEVKTRRLGSGEPWENLHDAKRSQVRRMAAAWLAEVTDRPWFAELRFDAVGVVIDPQGRLVRLDHLEAAF